MKKLNIFLVALVFIFLGFMNVKAENVVVASIGETNYATLDEAIKDAKDNDVINLLSDANVDGININKNLTIKSENNNKITFEKYGIALWGVNLSLENVDVQMKGIGSTPYTAEWNWMAIAASKDASLTLKNSTMLMDGFNTNNAHAIYFCSNNKLNLINSNLTIKNYGQDALKWDGGDLGYNVNMINSTFISDHNRSGFTGTFYVTIDNSNVDVINSTGNGSNGSNFIIKNNSVVNFNDNKAHGLSAGTLLINHSVVNANKNGGNGIHTNGTLNIENNSNVNVNNNKCFISSAWTIPGAIHIGNSEGLSVIKESIVNVTYNKGSGIYQKGEDASFVIQDNAKVTITNNEAKLLGLGGGIYANGNVTLPDNLVLYNNHANVAGDDIYSIKNIILGSTQTNSLLDECSHLINGWYDDNKNNRWNAHDESKEYLVLVKEGKYSTPLALKAAHDKLKGKVIVYYVDEEGRKLSPAKEMTGFVGEEYQTYKKAFDNYEFLRVQGDAAGKYIDGTIKVIYVYGLEETEEVGLIPPHTGADDFGFNGYFDNVNSIYIEEKKRKLLKDTH